MRGSWWFLLAALPALLPGCDSLPFLPRRCTLAGCLNGLSVQLSEQPILGHYRVDVVLPGGETRTVQCTQLTRCPEAAHFPDLRAEQVTIRVTTAAGTRTESFRPRYVKFRPNGRGCPPECWNARVVMRLPE